jgi:hypothetical protein
MLSRTRACGQTDSDVDTADPAAVWTVCHLLMGVLARNCQWRWVDQSVNMPTASQRALDVQAEQHQHMSKLSASLWLFPWVTAGQRVPAGIPHIQPHSSCRQDVHIKAEVSSKGVGCSQVLPA